jgi:hypothetical protein
MGTPDEDDHGWLTQSAHGLTIIRVPTHRFEDYVETIPGLRLRDILCIELARDEATDRGYAWITTMDTPFTPPFARLIPRRPNGIRLAKYCETGARIPDLRRGSRRLQRRTRVSSPWAHAAS